MNIRSKTGYTYPTDASAGGYTLVELVVTLTIISILTAISVVVFARARRVQEVDALASQIADLVTEARNSALSPDVEDPATGNPYRVYGVYFDSVTQQVEYWRYPAGCTGCSDSSSGNLIEQKSIDLASANMQYLKISLNYGGGVDYPAGGEPSAGFFFGTPFGRGCLRVGITDDYQSTEVPFGRPETVADTSVVDQDYPEDWTAPGDRKCAPDSLNNNQEAVLKVEIETSNNSPYVKKVIEINMLSGDVKV